MSKPSKPHQICIDAFVKEGFEFPFYLICIAANGGITIDRILDQNTSKKIDTVPAGKGLVVPLNVFALDIKGRTGHIVQGDEGIDPVTRLMLTPTGPAQ